MFFLPMEKEEWFKLKIFLERSNYVSEREVFVILTL